MPRQKHAFIEAVYTEWETGGGIPVDVIELSDGTTIVIGAESVSVYRSRDWNETTEAGMIPRPDTGEY